MKQEAIIIDKCPRCGESHSYTIKKEGLKPGISINLACPNIQRYARIKKINWGGGYSEPLKDQFIARYGSQGFEGKIEKLKKIKPYIMVIEEYNYYLQSIFDTYVMGYTYPFVTSSCCLIERVLNVLVEKLKAYFSDTSHYKKIEKYIINRKKRYPYANDSIADWGLMFKALFSRGIITHEQKIAFKKLEKYRNESIHFNRNYEFHVIMDEVLDNLMFIMTSLFDVFTRTDIIYPVPGEFWIRDEKMDDPFVKEFFVSNASMSTYVGNVFTDYYCEQGVIPGPLDQKIFFELKKKHKVSHNIKPMFCSDTLYGMNIFYRVI